MHAPCSVAVAVALSAVADALSIVGNIVVSFAIPDAKKARSGTTYGPEVWSTCVAVVVVVVVVKLSEVVNRVVCGESVSR